MKLLLMRLVKCETEQEVARILDTHPLTRDPANWRSYGGIDNNYGCIGNQQSEASSALVEKIVNAIDAMLLLRCRQAGIDPESSHAPAHMRAATEAFAHARDGDLANLTGQERTRLGDHIKVIATGSKKRPCIVIADRGEGQHPTDLPDTILSLLRSGNKDKVPFVQGRYNMGGTGALLYCGTHSFQLVVSRRHADLCSRGNPRPWGFTTVRRRRPEASVGNSRFEYLAPNGRIPSFCAETLPILPGPYPSPYGQPMSSGTFLKLYDYALKDKSLITATGNLYSTLSRRLYETAWPVRLIERREGYRGKTYETTLSGMAVRIAEDRGQKVEHRAAVALHVPEVGPMRVDLVLFRRGEGCAHHRWLTRSESTVFAVNGQTHAFLPRSFISSEAVRLDHLAGDLLCVVDCSHIDPIVREDLFMPSRDRMRDGGAKAGVQNALAAALRRHPALQQWNERRRQERMRERIADDTRARRVLSTLIHDHPDLAALFGSGKDLTAPPPPVQPDERYQGRQFPTFLTLTHPRPGEPKECPLNRTCRIVLETDADNDYFTRRNDHGTLTCTPAAALRSYHLWEGRLTVAMHPPHPLQPGHEFYAAVEVNDVSRIEPLKAEFPVRVTQPTDRTNANARTRGKRKRGGRCLKLPEVELIKQDRWHELEPPMTELSAIRLMNNGSGGLDAWVNADNLHLRRELAKRSRRPCEPELLTEQFKWACVLVGIAVREKLKNGDSSEDAFEAAMQGVAQVILPVVRSLGDLTPPASAS